MYSQMYRTANNDDAIIIMQLKIENTYKFNFTVQSVVIQNPQ